MAKEPKPDDVNTGLRVADGICPDCGKSTRQIVAKNGIVHARCLWPSSKTGDVCFYQGRHSKFQSLGLIANKLKQKAKPKQDRVDEPKTEQPAAKETEQPEPTEPERNAFGY